MCYELTFEGTRPGIAPDRVALLPGDGGGFALWLPSRDQQQGRHVMVGERGHWRAEGDSLVIGFQNPRLRSTIVLHGAGNVLRGRAGGMGHSPFATMDWRPVVARRFACPASVAAAPSSAG